MLSSVRAFRPVVSRSVRSMATAPVRLSNDWVSSAFGTIGTGEFIVDIGSGEGGWAMDLCKRQTDVNVLGLDIKGPVVEQCLQKKKENNINNVHFLHTNVHNDLKTILESVRSKDIQINSVTIQFPDVHALTRHKHKRVVNPAFVATLAKNLESGATVFFQTGVEELGLDMVRHFAASEQFAPAESYNAEQLHRNRPAYTVQTEWERQFLRDGKPVFRMMYTRTGASA